MVEGTEMDTGGNCFKVSELLAEDFFFVLQRWTDFLGAAVFFAGTFFFGFSTCLSSGICEEEEPSVWGVAGVEGISIGAGLDDDNARSQR